MATRRSSKRAGYPSRIVGSALEELVNRRNKDGEHSEAAVARWLGFPKSRFNNWITGYSHPKKEVDWQTLTRLGISRAELRRLELLDKLDAWAFNNDVSADELRAVAANVARFQKGAAAAAR